MKTNSTQVQNHFKTDTANPIHAAIADLDSVVVAHVALKDAISGLIDCISWTESGKEPRGAVLIGLGGTGKTTVCNTILKKFPPYDLDTAEAHLRIIPAFFASVPSPSTIKSLASSLLESLGDPTPLRGSAITMTARLCALLKQCRTIVILLDEFHHLLAEAAAGEPRANKVCNWIKSLINQTGVMVCLVGTPQCEALVNSDSQMSRRFCHRFRLTDLTPGTKAKPGTLSNFLVPLSKQFVERLQLKGFVNFKERLAVDQMWAATSGNPAFVAILLKEATAIALLARRDEVVLGDLAEAFDRGITASVARTRSNPFLMSAAVLAADIGSVKIK